MPEKSSNLSPTGAMSPPEHLSHFFLGATRALIFCCVIIVTGCLAFPNYSLGWSLNAIDSDADGAPDTSETSHSTDPGNPAEWPQPFTDVANSDGVYSALLWAWDNNIVAGCGGGLFCLKQVASRALAAKWLLLATEVDGYTPTSASGTIYNDVPAGSFLADWIEDASDRQITLDCGTDIYCPNKVLTRVEWAVMVVKSRNLPGYTPPAATSSSYMDVDIGIAGVSGDGDPYADWIVQYSKLGLDSACVAGYFCPNGVLTWSQMVYQLADHFDMDGDWIRNYNDDDRDGDGVLDVADLFPDDPLESVDTDGDGVGDNSDLFPSDPTESSDLDGDGIGDNSDPDRDGDGLTNIDDPFPNNPSDLAGHWPFDVIDNGTTPDSTINNLDGTVYGATLVTGQIGSALHFDGIDDYLSIPYESLHGASNMTIGVWMRTTSSTEQILLSGAEIYNSNSSRLHFHSQTEFCYYTGVRTWPRVCWDIVPVNDGSWHHIVVVRDDFNDTATLYIDGESLGTEYEGMDKIKLEKNGVILGQEQDEVGGEFDEHEVFSGDLDDLRIYRSAFNRTDVQNWYGGTNWSSIETRVAASTDDAERSTTWTSLNSWDLDLNLDTVGIRFTQVGIPIGATIEKAYIEWTSNATRDSAITIPITGEANSNPATFAAGEIIGDRLRTTASVDWTPGAWSWRSTHKSPDVTSIVQEIIGQPGWNIGNAMAFIFDADPAATESLRRGAFTWDSWPEEAPRLVIYYSGAAGDPSGPSAPTILTASAISNPVDLSWSASMDSDSGVSGYRLYRGDSPSNTFWLADIKNTLLYTDGTADSNTTYYYELSALNGAGVESPRSLAAEVTTGDNEALVAHLRFDDATGTTASDDTPNGLNGTLNSAIEAQPGPQWISGHLIGAVQFDGLDDYITLPREMINGAGDLSIGLWIKTTKTTSQVLVSGANSQTDYEFLLEMESSNEINFYTSNNGLGWEIEPINDGLWHHVLLVVDDIYNVVSLNIDGVSQGTQRLTIDHLRIDPGSLILGYYYPGLVDGWGEEYAFEGEMDDFRVYHQVLDWLEIQQVVAGDITPPSVPGSPGLVQGTGQQIIISWNPSVDPDTGICGYRIYRGTSSGNLAYLTEVGDVTTYTDSSTAANTTYHYQISAVNCIDGESTLTAEVSLLSGNDGMLAFTQLSAGDWNETAVRKILHAFAYAGLTTGAQITTWAAMAPNQAIAEILTLNPTNDKLSPAQDDSILHAGSLESLQDFWGGNDPTNPMRWDKRRYVSSLSFDSDGESRVSEGNLERAWGQAVATRGLNPFLHKLAFYLTNYQMSISVHKTGPALMRDYYDTLLGALVAGNNFVDVIAAGAKIAAVTRAYDHDGNIYHNDIMEFEGNDDFAREFFQLFFRLQGETEDPSYHEDTTIENNAHLLTGMSLDRQPYAYGSDNDNDWYISPIDFSDHTDGMGELHYNSTLHHANCVEILHRDICGATPAEKIDMLAPIVANHTESLDNLPVFIINFFADDNLTQSTIDSIQASWRTANFDLLAFLQAYAISDSFHNLDRYKYHSSFDRILTLFNTVALDNDEIFVGLDTWQSTEHWLSHQGVSVFDPAHDVFGHQIGLQAANNPNIFYESYKFHLNHNLLYEDRNTYADDETETSESTWYKDWGSVAPSNGSGDFVVSEVADWLWQRMVADGGKNFDIVARAQVYALLARGDDFGFVATEETSETNAERIFSSIELTTETELIDLIDTLSAETIALGSTDIDGDRRYANQRVGQAAQFIAILPYTFASEGK